MEDVYEVAFKIILHAGNAKSCCIEAVNYAENKDFETADEKMIEADNELKQAHLVQTKMLQDEANGSKQEMNLLMIHAQDHIAMALTQRDVSKQLIRLYKKLDKEKIC